ncbi:DegQ family serine endoprotease [Pikeienuella piscinae]|uniref:Probable periplasmic serine endoprotease DegP-like n=2 Tax=Pikeienuella piscinae TaxID=2748098 RepID=A0A7M3T6S7_9RHOB|nr:DegQ family serine endoprotease [Pikeienuella piscinae]
MKSLPLSPLERVRIVVVAALGAIMMLTAPGAALGAPDSFADLAERLSPAVVNIATTQTVTAPDRGPRPKLPPGSPFEDLFRDFFDGLPERGPRTTSSLGSGFVIDPDGIVVTNNHVIEDADEIVVNFSDGTTLPATLIGTDPKTDIALLKLTPPAPLVFVSFGDSSASRVGDWVLAIGNPFGLGGSVSAGIISARNRDINSGPYDDFIQTDAAINRGNSGGPLFNMAGEVIGVNTAIISPSGGSIGIGFSVPSALVKNVVSQLREFGHTKRGWLGVRIQQVTPELAEGLGLDKPVGALVSEVTADGPAAEGGIEAGDVIMKFDGRDIAEMRDLPRMVAETAVGKDVRVVIWRKGKTQTVKVVLGLLDEGDSGAPPEVDKPEAPAVAETALGMKLEPLTEKSRSDYGVAEDAKGVLVTEVDAGSTAAEKGVRPGDVIVEVAQEAVATPADVRGGVAKAKEEGRKSVLILVQSGADLRFVALKITN